MIDVPANIMTALNRISLKREREFGFISKTFSNVLPEIFEAVVLSGGETNSNNPHVGTAHGNLATNNPQEPSYYFARIRRKDIDELTTPDPFKEPDVKMTKKLANMHPIGVLEKSTGLVPKEGDIWTCRYLTKDRKGIILINRVGVDKGFLNLKEKDSLYQQAANVWENLRHSPVIIGDVAQVGPNGEITEPVVNVRVSQGTKIKGRLNFTWAQLKELAGMGIFEPLLNNIRQHECSREGCATKHFNGEQYDAFNYYSRYGKPGYIGNTNYIGTGWGPLSQWSIAQVRAGQSKGAKVITAGNGRLFATGGYQIIPKTFKSAVSRIQGLNTGDQFNKLNQNALGIYLVSMKRKTLGRYLFGDSVSPKSAGNDLAYEFASIRLQKGAYRKGKWIPAYVKYYGGVGVNKQGAVNKADADRSMNAINQVRAAIDKSPRAIAIRDLAKG